MISNNPFYSLSDELETNTNDRPTPKPFSFRPSSLQSHASTLLKDITLQKPSLTGFKLEPPKLFSPFSGKKNEDCSNSTEQATVEKKNDNIINEKPDVPKFIFGEKLEQRVTNIPETNSKESKNNGCNGEVDSSNLSFKANLDEQVAKSIQAAASSDEDISSTTGSAEASQSTQRTLAESVAQQLAKEEENRLDLKEVEVITGEENELNVFKFSAKLYMFEKVKQSWMERGFGTLRLNDRCLSGTNDIFQSRLVMRTHGCLRVILNTMLWPQMLIERSSGKMIKISAHDPEDASIKIYILSLNPMEADQVFTALTSRVQQLKLLNPHQVESTITKKRVKDELDPNEDDPYISPVKRSKLEADKVDTTGEESNDSNTQYPETEASNEGFTSSPNVQSSSSSEA